MGNDPVEHRPRVLVLIKGLGIGGAERLLSEGVRFWSRDAFEYRVAYVLPWKHQLAESFGAYGVRAECIGSRFWPIEAPFRLRRIVTSWKPDLIHAHLPMTGILARLVSSTPVVYTEHNVASSYRPLTRVLNRVTYPRNRAVVAVSDAVAASLAQYPGPVANVIPNGVSVSVTEAACRRVRRDLAIGPQQPLVVHVGNIRPWKGHSTLIQAARILSDRIPDVAIVSIGGEKQAGDLARVRQEAVAEGVAESLRFLGRRSDAVEYIASADVFVNPSDVEGLPLVVLEAMVAGTPVVATAAGGVPALIADRETGRLVPVGDAAALAGAMADLIEDRDSAAALAGRAQVLAHDDFGLERMVDANEELYRTVLGV